MNAKSPFHPYSGDISTTSSSTTEVLNPWLANGSMGAKETVLVFRTSVLSENTTNLLTNDIVDLEQLSSSTSSAEDFGLPATKRNYLPTIARNSVTNKSALSRLGEELGNATGEEEDFDAHQQTKENTSDNVAKTTTTPKNNKFKVPSKVTTTNRSEMPAALLNVQYRFLSTESRLLRKILHSHGIRESEEEPLFNLLWSGSHLKPDVLRNLAPYQRVNHFPR